MIVFDETLQGGTKGIPLRHGGESKILIRALSSNSRDFKMGLEMYVPGGSWFRIEKEVVEITGQFIDMGRFTTNLPTQGSVRVVLEAAANTFVTYRALIGEQLSDRELFE